MSHANRMFTTALMTALVAGCASAPPADTNGPAVRAGLGMSAPAGTGSGRGGSGGMGPADMMSYEVAAPVSVDLTSVPVGVYDPSNKLDNRGAGDRIESPLSDEQADALRQQAMSLPPSGIQAPGSADPDKLGPVAGVSFDSIDYTDCCGGGGNVPPDPELAVGPDHVLAVVNVAFEFYDKTGTVLAGPITFSSFAAGVLECTSPFDPNALYDEEQDRFIMGWDSGGDFYCLAVAQQADPIGGWWLYAIPTNINGWFFDYPHAGVGRDAIYMGANMFSNTFEGSRVWAFDKFDAYAGAPLSVATGSTGFESTPQPMNLHGFAQGTWPVSGPHYILTDDQFIGDTYGVWAWTDPFGANTFVDTGTVDIAAAIGVGYGFPIDAPQMGSPALLQANDWRVQDAEYRNGMVWMTSTASCNPGAGVVDCVRWAQIDPTGPSVVDAGIVATNGEFRTFPDLAVNDCNDMAMGYTKTSTAMYPSVYVTGRESTDPSGTTQPEVMLKGGELPYTAFDGSPHRWGDYTGMTIDPDGQTFWYLGEYSKDTGTSNGRWGNYIGSFSYPACSGAPFFYKTIDFGNDRNSDTIPDKVVEVGTLFQSFYGFTINYFDPAGTPVQIKDVVPEYWGFVAQSGGSSPCSVIRAEERRNLYSDAFITCTPAGGVNAWSFVATARGIPDGFGSGEYEPTECGAFYLNEGAVAKIGRSVFEGPTDPLCLAAVRDINGGGLVFDGTGDEDGDGVSDYVEACENGTDPCVPN